MISAGGDFDKPKDGYEYVIVTVNIKNAGTEKIGYNPFDFTMQNSRGQILDETLSIENNGTALSSGDLSSGGFVSGTIIFEQPKDDQGLKLIYQPSMTSGKTVTFDLMNSLEQFDVLAGGPSTQASAAYKIGDVAQLSGYSIQVTEVQKSSGSDFEKPKDGYEFVIVTVRIKNSGADTVSYNPFDFSMKNSRGQIENQTITAIDSNTALSSGELAPGGLVSGTIAFEEPKDDAGLELIFQKDMFSSDSVAISLNNKLDAFDPLQ